ASTPLPLPTPLQQRNTPTPPPRRQPAGSTAGETSHGSVPTGREAAAGGRRHQRERDPYHHTGPHPQLRHLRHLPPPGKKGERNCVEGHGTSYQQDSGYYRDHKGWSVLSSLLIPSFGLLKIN
uniref:Uncharacterized protein n=1 Tax=Triticum urartu TaxID=4572 RepID=A0A8R7Q934_TRIUA